jgi:hypothetical protein
MATTMPASAMSPARSGATSPTAHPHLNSVAAETDAEICAEEFYVDIGRHPDVPDWTPNSISLCMQEQGEPQRPRTLAVKSCSVMEEIDGKQPGLVLGRFAPF